jgi:hypothetical protein
MPFEYVVTKKRGLASVNTKPLVASPLAFGSLATSVGKTRKGHENEGLS